jgi:hypothetical protein
MEAACAFWNVRHVATNKTGHNGAWSCTDTWDSVWRAAHGPGCNTTWTQKKKRQHGYGRVNTTNGVWPPARNRFPPFTSSTFAMSQQTTYRALSLAEATWRTALHVTVAQVHMPQSIYLGHRIDRDNETSSDSLSFLGCEALSLDVWFRTFRKNLVTLSSKVKQVHATFQHMFASQKT